MDDELAEDEDFAEQPGLNEGGRVGDFTLVELLGRGGMGQVWKASDGTRDVALREHIRVRTETLVEVVPAVFDSQLNWSRDRWRVEDDVADLSPQVTPILATDDADLMSPRARARVIVNSWPAAVFVLAPLQDEFRKHTRFFDAALRRR